MKTNLTLFLLLLMVLSVKGQLTTDREAILQKCIDLPEIQNLLPADASGQPEAIYIMQHAVSFDENMKVTKFGKNLEFLTKDQVYNQNCKAYFRFDKFEIDNDIALISFDFEYNRNTLTDPGLVKITLNMQKNGTEWSITESKFNWR